MSRAIKTGDDFANADAHYCLEHATQGLRFVYGVSAFSGIRDTTVAEAPSCQRPTFCQPVGCTKGRNGNLARPGTDHLAVRPESPASLAAV